MIYIKKFNKTTNKTDRFSLIIRIDTPNIDYINLINKD